MARGRGRPTLPTTIVVQTTRLKDGATMMRLRCLHYSRAEVRVAEDEEPEAIGELMRSAVATVRAVEGCACGDEILAQCGDSG